MDFSVSKLDLLKNLFEKLDKHERIRLEKLIEIHQGRTKRKEQLLQLFEILNSEEEVNRKTVKEKLAVSSQILTALVVELLDKAFDALLDHEVVNIRDRLPENQKRVIETKKKLLVIKIVMKRKLYIEGYSIAQNTKDFCEKYEFYYDLIEVLELIEYLRIPLGLSDKDLGYDSYQELKRANKLSSLVSLSRTLFYKIIQNPFASPKKAQYKDEIQHILGEFHQFGDFSFSRNLTVRYLFLQIELSLIKQRPKETLKRAQVLLNYRLENSKYHSAENIAVSYIYFGLSNLINFKNEEALTAFLDAKKLLSKKSPNYTIASINEALTHFRLGNYRFVLNIYENYKDKELYFQRILLLFLQASSLFMLEKYVDVLDFVESNEHEFKKQFSTRFSIFVLRIQALVELEEYKETARLLENLRKLFRRYEDEVTDRQKIIYSILDKFLKYGVFHQKFVDQEAREIIQLVKEMSEQILHGSEIITFDYWLVQKLPENWRKDHLPNIQKQLEARYNIQTVLALLGE